MKIHPCPRCSRLPKISEGLSRNGKRFYLVSCPNYCSVLRPESDNAWTIRRSYLTFNDDLDYNAMFKKWNEELIDNEY